MRILLVDDHPLVRQALSANVSQIRADLVVEEFDTLAAMRKALAIDHADVLVLLDLSLPDNTGMAGLLSLRATYPDVPVAIVSANDDRQTIMTAKACGAAGFIPKTAGVGELSAAIEELIDGGAWFPAFPGAVTASSLTPTQCKIFDGVKRGLMNKQIAHELGLSEHTVKFHLTAIFRKYGCQTRSQLMSIVLDRT